MNFSQSTHVHHSVSLHVPSCSHLATANLRGGGSTGFQASERSPSLAAETETRIKTFVPCGANHGVLLLYAITYP